MFDAEKVKKMIEQDGFLMHVFNLAMDDDAVKDINGKIVVPGDEAKALRQIYEGYITRDSRLSRAYGDLI